MHTDKAKQILRSHGATIAETVDHVVAIPRDRTAKPHAFAVSYKQSQKDGFAEGHVDGREVRHWLGY